ncbi:hypothetical protein A3F62_00820 [Candidatus Woesebacteria bacterium RIFCSPHIGHO2_12_FULL_44_11]|uniref:FAD/NAD(P)-binding domain-containing protein n=1 Tax=Candidatus Woesebacteria bacterium RIFCSPLOWO2_01_FULL_44_14 TaxID=1802525 RepID=A0A1F8C480_9BACT|nr:MAG: hypothetical protein A3F62_00820 [Candidatus Woesebacteria bacterium RIFCSPHIGHO2_12_FULL_44_11]OGM70960.1 MAG: hypothetical protein A2975_01665 [Candidatus Woesebacteria bacterium RIFCSPLOWO2_01_FULL_44_14]
MREIDFDVTVVGGGIAGSEAARNLANQGFKTALIEKRRSPPEKSLFVNSDLLPQDLVSRLAERGAIIPVPNHLLINTDDSRRNWGKREESSPHSTFAVFHPPIIEDARNRMNGEIEQVDGSYKGSFENYERVTTQLSNERLIISDFLIDASGDFGIVGRLHQVEGNGKLMVEDDPLVLWLKGVRVFGKFEEGLLIDPIGSKVGLSWVLPYSADYGDIVSADICRLSELKSNLKIRQQIFNNLLKYCVVHDLCEIRVVEQNLTGFIRCEPISPAVSRKSARMYQVGASAGMGSPLMAEVVPAALNWASRLAEEIAKGATPYEFYRRWRFEKPMFPYDLELAMLKRRVVRQKKGIYGSNHPVYRAILDYLPDGEQKKVLSTRKISPRYWPRVLAAIADNPELVPNLAELGFYYGGVKVNNALNGG